MSSGTRPTHDLSVYAAWCGAASAPSSAEQRLVHREVEDPVHVPEPELVAASGEEVGRGVPRPSGSAS